MGKSCIVGNVSVNTIDSPLFPLQATGKGRREERKVEKIPAPSLCKTRGFTGLNMNELINIAALKIRGGVVE